jgi:hypothetical protein
MCVEYIALFCLVLLVIMWVLLEVFVILLMSFFVFSNISIYLCLDCSDACHASFYFGIRIYWLICVLYDIV